MTTLHQYRGIISVVGLALIAVWVLGSEAELDGASYVAGAVAAYVLCVAFLLPWLHRRRASSVPDRTGAADDA
ncbi:MAG: hypothetical protein NTV28_09385 [Propionibacteriales bacterium]|nr:hypothetical protein [Propionibacteriales bacterium]